VIAGLPPSTISLLRELFALSVPKAERCTGPAGLLGKTKRGSSFSKRGCSIKINSRMAGLEMVSLRSSSDLPLPSGLYEFSGRRVIEKDSPSRLVYSKEETVVVVVKKEARRPKPSSRPRWERQKSRRPRRASGFAVGENTVGPARTWFPGGDWNTRRRSLMSVVVRSAFEIGATEFHSAGTTQSPVRAETGCTESAWAPISCCCLGQQLFHPSPAAAAEDGHDVPRSCFSLVCRKIQHCDGTGGGEEGDAIAACFFSSRCKTNSAFTSSSS